MLTLLLRVHYIIRVFLGLIICLRLIADLLLGFKIKDCFNQANLLIRKSKSDFHVLALSHPMKTLGLCQELWSGLVRESFQMVFWARNQPELYVRYLQKFKDTCSKFWTYIFHYLARHRTQSNCTFALNISKCNVRRTQKEIWSLSSGYNNRSFKYEDRLFQLLDSGTFEHPIWVLCVVSSE